MLTRDPAGQYFKAHRNILGPDDPLVRQAKTGDRVVIWIRAQYPVSRPFRVKMCLD